ncbi:MAG: twin-arginine translocation signal domain-containing protein, partial [Chloroflexi bacterium]|nr:twin-arginine translocation signal domain-containing protein [Chloroflexota bacterium]
MEISRREFLKYLGASAAALAMAGVPLDQIESALAASNSPAVIWLQGSACTGCSVSLLNAVNPTIDQVLLNTVSVKYHNNLMTAAGDLAVSAARSTQAAG